MLTEVEIQNEIDEIEDVKKTYADDHAMLAILYVSSITLQHVLKQKPGILSMLLEKESMDILTMLNKLTGKETDRSLH